MARPLEKLAFAALVFTVASLASASDHHRHERTTNVTPATTVFVTVQKVTGLNSDGDEHVLYDEPLGIHIPLKNLVQAGMPLPLNDNVPDGVYHDLRVKLSNELDIDIPDRAPIRTEFRTDHAPVVLRMMGTVVYDAGTVRHDSLTLDTRDPMDDRNADRVVDRKHHVRSRYSSNHGWDDDDHGGDDAD